MLSIHGGIAAMVKDPCWALTEDESRRLASAMAAVAEHYDLAASAKTLAWINLGAAAIGIYGPRIYAAFNRRKAAAKAQPKPQSESGPELHFEPLSPAA